MIPEAPESPSASVSRIESLAIRELTPCGAGSMVWRVWGSGRPLILLHGASGSWTHWIRNIVPLARSFRVIAPDMPGFGDSDTPPEPHTADVLADLLACGLNTLVPPPMEFDMAGFSFGGIIAGLVAARLEYRVRTLVLLGAGGLGLGSAPPLQLLQPRPDMTRADLERVHGENLRILMIADPRKVDELAVFLQIENIRRARFKSGTIPASGILLHALPAIRARIAGISGSYDAIMGPRLDAYRRVLASAQPDLDLRVVAGAGHWVTYEAAEEVTALLQDILANPRLPNMSLCSRSCPRALPRVRRA
ncbi:MAG TPA: alpha/beta fold hydrolase [Candidatus Binataceae bacterium]|nr:alpha/beta fold hydrolase [Candidatus Binataceae bacterium]